MTNSFQQNASKVTGAEFKVAAAQMLIEYSVGNSGYKKLPSTGPSLLFVAALSGSHVLAGFGAALTVSGGLLRGLNYFFAKRVEKFAVAGELENCDIVAARVERNRNNLTLKGLGLI